MNNLYIDTFLILIAIGLIVVFFIIPFVIIRKRIIKRNRELLQTVTNKDRGNKAERRLILRLLKNDFPAITLYHDLYVDKSKGEYSQIDAVLLTKIGVIVFEVKDYSGWIFGDGDKSYWTKVLAYGEEKYRFYNPIKQNKNHINALKDKTNQCGDIPFYSIIVFYGDCRLKEISNIPEETYLLYPFQVEDRINYLLENKPQANYTNKRGLISILRDAVNNGNNPNIISQHIEFINSKYY